MAKVKANREKHSKHKKINGIKVSNHKKGVDKADKGYKAGLLEIDKQEEKFDKLFEQKLSQQYKNFRNLKDHHIQTKKFIRIFIVLMTIILITLLLASFR
jgi:hypothetical protein